MKQQRENSEIYNRGGGLKGADLTGAGLEGACLYRANLAEAILDGANLRGSDLQGANLRKASLYEADLKGANLGGSNLGMSDLRRTCLEETKLSRVNLNRANLLGARLVGARLDHVDLASAILPDGARYEEGMCIERYTDKNHPDFDATLALIHELGKDTDNASPPETEAEAYRKLPWKQFVEQTYGSLADNPIELHVYGDSLE
ncbi:MAG: pentapeptide repeat-containing protein [Chloroflexota bacterium]|nr:pentapeptide repeat-containing protein [Chloroflexota bacterium]